MVIATLQRRDVWQMIDNVNRVTDPGALQAIDVRLTSDVPDLVAAAVEPAAEGGVARAA